MQRRTEQQRFSSLNLLTPELAPEPNGVQVVEIPMGEIHPNRNQVRSVFKEEAIQDLAKSIENEGLIQPIVVRAVPESLTVRLGGKRYEIVAGERRFRAFQALGRQTIQAIVREIPEDKMRLVALIENIQREDLALIEKAESIARLKKELGSVETVWRAIGISRPLTFLYARIGELDEELKDAIHRNGLGVREADKLAGIVERISQSNDRDLEFRVKKLLCESALDRSFLDGIETKYAPKKATDKRTLKGAAAPANQKAYWETKRDVHLRLSAPIGKLTSATVRQQAVKDAERYFKKLGATRFDVRF